MAVRSAISATGRASTAAPGTRGRRPLTPLPASMPPTTARRAELFDALMELFLAEGFSSFTLEALADRLRCSKSTLYTLARSKEQLARAVVVHFFRRATEHVEARIDPVPPRSGRVAEYLAAVSAELAPAGSQFYADLISFPPASEIYDRNTVLAAQRVRELIEEGVAAGAYRAVDTAFAADLVTGAMTRIGRGELRGATGIDDAAAYAKLADLVLNGLQA